MALPHLPKLDQDSLCTAAHILCLRYGLWMLVARAEGMCFVWEWVGQCATVLHLSSQEAVWQMKVRGIKPADDVQFYAWNEGLTWGAHVGCGGVRDSEGSREHACDTVHCIPMLSFVCGVAVCQQEGGDPCSKRSIKVAWPIAQYGWDACARPEPYRGRPVQMQRGRHNHRMPWQWTGHATPRALGQHRAPEASKETNMGTRVIQDRNNCLLDGVLKH